MYHAYLILEEWYQRDPGLFQNKQWQVGVYSDSTLSQERLHSGYTMTVLIHEIGKDYIDAETKVLNEMRKRSENDPIYVLYLKKLIVCKTNSNKNNL